MDQIITSAEMKAVSVRLRELSEAVESCRRDRNMGLCTAEQAAERVRAILEQTRNILGD